MTKPAAVLRLSLIALLTVILASQATGTATAQRHDEVESRNLATVQHGFDAWRAGTGSPYDALADDATWEIVGNSAVSRVYTSKEDFLAAVIRPFNSRMLQRLVPTIRDIYADGDTVIVFFDAEGTALDGIPYRNTYSWFLTFNQDNIVRASAFFDSIAFNDLWERVPAG